MKNFKLIVMLAVFIISCDNSKKSSNDIVQLRIENYIDSTQSKYPNYESNSVIKEELIEFLKKDFKEAVNKGVLIDLPFKLNTVEKCGEKYILKLEHSLISKLYDRGVLNDIEIDLYALTDEKTAKSLQEEEFYLVNIKFKDYITFQNNEKYCALSLMSPFMGYFSNEIQFGAIAVDLKSIDKISIKIPN